ncbi:MAG: 30S ribosomal protein S16 [Candidatus Portnoybacteria bacterium RIFCSPLOWO2_01_FULL_43_11]|uniref:Small ribosomal subunit protein bS16 n=4 Tax=Candidatus Portnoyibacteriota TaxID=1817913 RepID=A0A1G2FDW5_9BACT|nr:MAG: 30S ribosomal protein S16 [Candidatus Portnoybacteria bacterium RIFCSPHIGHO2_01_FULL_40_12b]OGZ39179.1 MAG: 30S ribosomal protein S16 [Candidatus Portnoybacteria bacterium RIFCSPLOWO2_01_FULL_43_11]OGZ39193.1 MAG: 30S ribosomal protein S16 [Candidatus Portnoybacteria bacterium RIFCSPHIGHO2_12_FULL_40_11]OGZ39909.1 MAG: 30S ribosomal protein S16 [Candidatus Portnoybacteria bacterium RIFCSPLOWO2_02_FULL_40_15]
MLIVRLLRVGKKNAPSFRIVLIEKSAPPKSGKFLEILGFYNPRSKEINIKKERILYWISKGVKASETVHNLLVSQDIIKGPKIKKKIKKGKETIETKEEKKQEEKGKEEVGVDNLKEMSKIDKE